jgi:pimeloyl-ACP methyl ester carboxylesterase
MPPIKNICLMPGLAFDRRMFQKLDLSPHELQFLDWEEPLGDEPLRAYAERVSKKIVRNGLPLVLVGHSFGGVLAQEVGALVGAEKVVLISSIKSRRERPMFFKVLGALRLYRLVSTPLALLTFPLWGKKHGYETAAERALFRAMAGGHSSHYLRWALGSLSRWKGAGGLACPVVHLHGDRDKTFPLRLIEKPVQVVEGGGHFMVYKQAQLVSDLILENI